MKVSEVSPEFMVNYMRIDEPSEHDMALITAEIAAGIQFISSYSGIGINALDEYVDFAIVLMVLVQDMYDTRTLYIEKSNLNKVVESILGRYSVNLIA